MIRSSINEPNFQVQLV